MKKEHGQVTGVIWRGPADLATYQKLRQYALKKGISVSTAAKLIISQTLNAIEK
jgi:hypothetical protein